MTNFDILAIIGAGAWLYPIGIAIRKLIVKPVVRVTLADTVQIGYTTFGPILNLQCAISTKYRDALIEKIEANVIHEKGDSHVLAWKHYAEAEVMVVPFTGDGGSTLSKRDVAIALQVSTAALTQKNIHFEDHEFHRDAKLVVDPFLDRVNHLRRSDETESREAVVSSQEYSVLTAFFKNGLYWKAGRYELEITVCVGSLTKPHTERFHFVLAQREVDDLKKNADLFQDALYRALVPADETADGNKLTEDWHWLNPLVVRVE